MKVLGQIRLTNLRYYQGFIQSWPKSMTPGILARRQLAFYPGVQNPDKEMNRREVLNQPMREQIAGLSQTFIISLSE